MPTTKTAPKTDAAFQEAYDAEQKATIEHVKTAEDLKAEDAAEHKLALKRQLAGSENKTGPSVAAYEGALQAQDDARTDKVVKPALVAPLADDRETVADLAPKPQPPEASQ